MEILIRKASIDDFNSIQKLSLQLEKAEYPFDSNLKKECNLDERLVEKTKKDLNDKEKIYLVAEIDNEIAGFIAGEVLDKWFYKEKVAMLNYICVDKKYQNNGVAQCLLGEFQKIMKLKGSKYLRLNAFSHNEPAINFYEKNDFSEYSVIYQKKL